MNPEKRHLKIFGYGLAMILAFISFKLLREHSMDIIGIILLFFVVMFVLLTKFRLEKLVPFYQRWMRVAHFIGSIVTCLFLSLIFYIVFGLSGILLRLLRKDLLDRCIDPGIQTYWIKKEETAFAENRYTTQF